MKSIPLTQGKFALVDDASYEEINKYKWYYHNGYAARWTGATYKETRKIIYMHRQILKTELYVDHIDRNKLNNQTGNLRECNFTQNLMNTPAKKGNLSGYKGVSIHKASGLYRARIQNINIGYYKTPEAAARAYDEKAKELFGDFAEVNYK